MIKTMLPRAPDRWATGPAPDCAALLEQVASLRQENAALRAENAALQAESAVLHERIQELEARLGQTSANSSRPPSSDPPQAPARPKAPPTGRKRGGQVGHRGACRGLLPVEQVDEIVAVVPERCRHCQQPFPATATRRRTRVWRHQVVELLPLAVRVIEYQMAVRRCPACGKHTRADLPVGVPRRPFGARLTAVIALLSGRYRLSRREVRQPRDPGPQSSSTLSGTDEVVAGAMDLRPRGGRRPDEQGGRARPTAGRAMAQGQFRLG